MNIDIVVICISIITRLYVPLAFFFFRTDITWPGDILQRYSKPAQPSQGTSTPFPSFSLSMSPCPCLCLTVDALESLSLNDGVRLLKTEEKEELTLNDPILQPFFENLLKTNNFEGIPNYGIQYSELIFVSFL